VVFSKPVRTSTTSYLLALVSQQALAQEMGTTSPNTDNSQTMPLLEASAGPETNRNKSGENIATVGGVALLPETGPSGSLVNVDGASGTDQISIYTVHEGDTLPSIAKLFDVSKNTILWANNIKGDKVSVGDRLVILPVSGVRHVVKKGDTVSSIAKKYKADSAEVAQFNDIAVNESLSVGDIVIVPDGQLDGPVQTPTKGKPVTGKNLDNYFIRPIIGGLKTQGIHGHNGVDLASSFGTPIMAAASGVVIVSKTSGYNGGYGNFIVINHPNGTQTLYGHLSENLVSVGDEVAQGQIIGHMGSTGHSTGNHVHFEVHGARNPF
jgi:LysM repeat protein